MKTLALAVAVTAGTLFSAGTADAQFRSRGSYGSSYAVPTYTYPTYSTYSYAAPSYYGVVPSSYTPYVSSGTVVTSGYTSAYTPTVYPSGSYYPSTWNAPYSGSYYNSSSYYGSGYNNGVYITPSGVNVGGRRAWRW